VINKDTFNDMQNSFNETKNVEEAKLSRFHTMKNIIKEEMEEIGRIINLRLKHFVELEELTKLKTFVQSKKQQEKIMLFTAQSGMGKSTLLCKLITDLGENNKDYVVLPFFCGITPFSCLVDNLIYALYFNLWSYLADKHGLKENAEVFQSFYKIREAFARLLKYAEAKKAKVIIIVDDVDRLYPCMESNNLLWLRELPLDNTRVIFSCEKDDGIHGKRAENLGIIKGMAHGFSSSNVEEYITKRATEDNDETEKSSLVPENNEELSNRLIKLIATEVTKDSLYFIDPLYVGLLVQKLIMMEYYDNDELNKLAESMPREEAVCAFYSKLIKESGNDYIAAYRDLLDKLYVIIDLDLVFVTLVCIAWSRRGLRVEDLENTWDNLTGMERWEIDDFIWLCDMLGDFFAKRDYDNRWDYTHNELRRFYTYYAVGDDEDPFEDEEEEELRELKHAVVCAFYDDESEYTSGELMHMCRWARAPERAGKAIAEKTYDERLTQLYAEGLRDIIYAENNYNEPEKSFLIKILRWAETENEDTLNAVCKIIIKVMSLLQSVVVRVENNAWNYRVGILRRVLDSCMRENENTSIKLILTAAHTCELIYEIFTADDKIWDAKTYQDNMIELLEDIVQQADKYKPDEVLPLFGLLGNAYTKLRDDLQYSDYELADIYNDTAMKLFKAIISAHDSELWTPEMPSESIAWYEYSRCLQWSALALLSDEKYEEAREIISPIYDKAYALYYDSRNLAGNEAYREVFWLSGRIMIRCKMGLSDFEGAENYLLKAVDLTNLHYSDEKGQYETNPVEIETARNRLQQALRQVSAFYKEQGKRKEAAKYKDKMMDL